MSNEKIRILVIDDEKGIRITFKTFLSEAGYTTFEASDMQSAIEVLGNTKIDIIFADVILGESTGIDILKEVKKRNLDCPVIIITGRPNIETAADSVRLGAFDYLTKPVRKDTLLRTTLSALKVSTIIEEKKRLQRENDRYRNDLEAIFRSVREAIITVKKDTKINTLNQAAETLFRKNSQQIIGTYLDKLFEPTPEVSSQVFQKTIKEGENIYDYQFEFKRPGKSNLTLMLNSSPLIDSANNTVGAVLVITDTTRLFHLEKELKERFGFHNIIGKSESMQEIYKLLEDLAETDTTVLITGESGTGKELIAKALHYTSSRSSKPMITVNCSALADNLLESELFGHVKGAFTGAVKDRTGRFQASEGGSIFLDEIGDISATTQVKLLRFLQEREFEIVGTSTTVKADVRLIAATNHNLRKDIQDGNFREDLYYRLKVVEVEVPPLRERTEDIALLAKYFCDLFNNRFNRTIQGVTDEVVALLMNYYWPGNIRELEHTMEYAFVRCHDKMITVDHIPKEIINYSIDKFDYLNNPKENEKTRILSVLEKSAGNKTLAAKKLGLSRMTLYRKMQKYRLDK